MKKIVMLNEELRTQMQIYLALQDAFKVEIAEDTESAMYLLRKMKPEILVMDYNLEGILNNGKTGIDFVKKVKKKYHSLKVLMILDDHEKNFAPEIEKYGVDILYKPIKNKSLIRDFKKISTFA